MADDLLQGVKDAVGANNLEGGNGGDPKATIGEFLNALENMEGISDEDKASLAKGLLQGGFGGAGGSQLPVGSPIANPWLEFAVLFGLIILITLTLGYIGFRLYYNMVERERKKELKKLKKEQKKKK